MSLRVPPITNWQQTTTADAALGNVDRVAPAALVRDVVNHFANSRLAEPLYYVFVSATT